MTEKPKNLKTQIPVFSAKLAGALVDAGFPIVNQSRNYKNPKLWVYYFENTEELQHAWTEIVNQQ